MHTPEPWTAENSGTVTCVYAKDSIGSDRRICEMIGPDEEDNARLIAASPRLLKALQGMLEAFRHPDNIEPVVAFYCTEKAIAAIAKATGQPATA